jgi:hypothetical protein
MPASLSRWLSRETPALIASALRPRFSRHDSEFVDIADIANITEAVADVRFSPGPLPPKPPQRIRPTAGVHEIGKLRLRQQDPELIATSFPNIAFPRQELPHEFADASLNTSFDPTNSENTSVATYRAQLGQ